jgi:hypothetical protein
MLDNGEGLRKIGHLNSEAPMLSIPVEGRRYAIANLGSDCQSFDMVFRGTGTYTLSFNGNTGYCHLIDRVAGKDIDMLRQNYTFSSNGFDCYIFQKNIYSFPGHIFNSYQPRTEDLVEKGAASSAVRYLPWLLCPFRAAPDAFLLPYSFHPEVAVDVAGFGAGLLYQPADAMTGDIVQFTKVTLSYTLL